MLAELIGIGVLLLMMVGVSVAWGAYMSDDEFPEGDPGDDNARY